MPEKENEFRRNLHLWIVAAETWEINEWRKNITYTPAFFKQAARSIVAKNETQKRQLLERAANLPADNPTDYVRYEIIADLCSLSTDALSKLKTAMVLNEMDSIPEGGAIINWKEVYPFAYD